jgi:hypothetical protein
MDGVGYLPSLLELDRRRYLGEDWAAFVNLKGSEAQRRYLNFVNLSAKSMKRLRGVEGMGGKGARRAVTFTLLPNHAKRIQEFPRGDRSAIVNTTLCRGWLWPVLWRFTETLHNQNCELRAQIRELERVE